MAGDGGVSGVHVLPQVDDIDDLWVKPKSSVLSCKVTFGEGDEQPYQPDGPKQGTSDYQSNWSNWLGHS